MPAAPSRDTRDSNPAGSTPANGNGDGPRRSSLVQERSRRTRQELVNAAVKLWTERGFEHGVESTTVEEIARAAGVTKGTFYFHFAHKEDVLLEMSLTTSDAVTMKAASRRRAAARRSTRSCSRRSPRWRGAPSACPRAAIARTIGEFYKYPTRARELSMTRRVWPELIADAQARGELPTDIDPADLSDMMNALMITAVEGWVHGAHDALAPELAYRMRVLFAGVRAEHAG